MIAAGKFLLSKIEACAQRFNINMVRHVNAVTGRICPSVSDSDGIFKSIRNLPECFLAHSDYFLGAVAFLVKLSTKSLLSSASMLRSALVKSALSLLPKTVNKNTGISSPL
jgi:hypothetical protein